ncbi:hypothetical protein [Sphingopyxis sp. Geo25]|uniref:hypothetical protein n=1 Tax=Sphingopyxis sp. Geo25 TaxID=3032247 RepID=UPI0024B72205|nr:hypothetical protein [Sphingopyxis sp. Geo25]
MFPASMAPKREPATPLRNVATRRARPAIPVADILGGVPSFAHFEAVALARSQKCKLVSAKKGLSDCQSIAKSNGLPKSDIIKIKDI